MEKPVKYKSNNLCIVIFTLCLSVRFVEYFLFETDKTIIGENVFHKVVGIILLAVVLKRVNLTWSDIGFQKNGFVKGVLEGLLLGSVCFAVSYGLELAILALQGNPAHFEIYISSFSLTGFQTKNTGFVFFVLCIVFNVINVWMEEGIFRGLFLKMLSETKPFMKANFIAAFLFPQAMSQADAQHPFGECCEGQIPRQLAAGSLIWHLAHCHANPELCKWRNVICRNDTNEYRLWHSFRNYGD